MKKGDQMTTNTQLTQDDLHQIELDKEREINKKQIKKLVETYCEMYNWGCHEALTDCLTTLCEQKGFTTDYAIERLNNTNDEYMEDM